MRPVYDVVVIGAGPVGGYLARRLNEHGHSVILIEEHDEIGRPFQCAGLVNPLAMKKVALEHSILTNIWGANIHSPSGNRVTVGNPSISRTFSVCRKLFDESVVMQSVATGSDIRLSSKPTSVVFENEKLIVSIDGLSLIHISEPTRPY